MEGQECRKRGLRVDDVCWHSKNAPWLQAHQRGAAWQTGDSLVHLAANSLPRARI